ncbi:cell wall elongation regulator TseB-like domain-containing protein [Shouchella rhizosphaerae]|uniref:cell wall elongation regulator TseB-like domain-containing protein n=1 Tax=Shouchella rhizosphaerae TaxID=866786 RepID=UPI003F7FE478
MKKKLSIIFSVVLLIVIGLGIYLYTAIRSPLTEGAKEATAFVTEQGIMAEVDDVSFYHGEESYWIVSGTSDEGEALFAWVNDDPEKRESTLVLPQHAGVPIEEMKETVAQELGVTAFDSVRLGYENGQAVYEFTYTSDTQGKLFYYTAFETGEYMKSFSIRTN